MNRRSIRALWPLALLLALMAWRAAGCSKSAPARKGAPGGATTAAAPKHWITPLMTAPPPRPTVTMWKGATRVPALPE
ncbi:MAG TPA: hypothetical protein VGG65_06295 [Thermoanaerobaculia bacterium]